MSHASSGAVLTVLILALALQQHCLTEKEPQLFSFLDTQRVFMSNSKGHWRFHEAGSSPKIKVACESSDKSSQDDVLLRARARVALGYLEVLGVSGLGESLGLGILRLEACCCLRLQQKSPLHCFKSTFMPGTSKMLGEKLAGRQMSQQTEVGYGYG